MENNAMMDIIKVTGICPILASSPVEDAPAAAQALDEAVDDELGHGVGGAAQGRAGQEQSDGHQEEVLASHEVAELAVDRHGNGDGQGVGGQDPGHVGGAAEVAHDGGQGRADNRLVHGGQEHDHQE